MLHSRTMRSLWKQLLLLAALIGLAFTPPPLPEAPGALPQQVYLPFLFNGSKLPSPSPTPSPTPRPAPSPTQNPVQYFSTLLPGSTLPGDDACAAAVKPRPENKGVNASFNSVQGSQSLAVDFFSPGSGDPRANSEIAARVTGRFSGTTDEILQWAACKWGIDEDLVRAQTAIESWWRQDTKGDWGSDAGRCPPGHGLGVDGRAGLCPESWGVLQNRYPYEQSSWPGIASSTAFNADTAYAIWRACFEGYEWWLNHVERGQDYAAGDAWGCMGRWFSGRWHTPAAEGYIDRVQGYLYERIWEQPDFQEP